MAASKSSRIYNIPIHEDELSCPVCYDELHQDPKVLPECAHTVCLKCLENIARRSESQHIECPMCRVQSKIPKDGVERFPTDHLVKKMVENIPGRKEKIALEQALNDCEDKIAAGKATLESIDKMISEAAKDSLTRSHELKNEISEHANKLRELILEEEKRLYHEVDDSLRSSFEALELKRRKKELLQKIKQAEVCTINVRQVLKVDCLEDITELKDVLVEQLEGESKELLVPRSSLETLKVDDTIRFDKNMTLFSKRKFLGSLNKLREHHVNRIEKVSEEQNSPVSVELEFEPLSIAVSQADNEIFVGILRSDVKQFDVFDIRGNFVTSVQLDAVPASHLYDINFSMNDQTVLVLDIIDQQMLVYSLSGRCLKTQFLDKNIKFISLDHLNRIILTTSRQEVELPQSRMLMATQACTILVFHPNKNEIQLEFGEESLINPSGRAVFHNESFFVPDNYSDLKMFNGKGEYTQTLQLNGVNPQDYNIFAIDVYNHLVIACNSKKKIVKIFSISDFSLVSSLNIPDVPWMIEALPSTKTGKSRLAIIYDESTRLDIITAHC